MLEKIKQYVRIFYLRFKYKASNVMIHRSSIVYKDLGLEGYNQIFQNTFFKGSLGFGSYISGNCRLSADIGRFTSIGPWVMSNSGRHAYLDPYVTTSPLFFSLRNKKMTFAKKQVFEEFSFYDVQRKIDVRIGSDCWIGENVFFVGGVEVNDGAVVLAHAVVTKNVPPYAIVGGIPAKILRYRYNQETIDFLQRVKWWNNSKEWFEINWELLNDIEKLKQYYNNDRRC